MPLSSEPKVVELCGTATLGTNRNSLSVGNPFRPLTLESQILVFRSRDSSDSSPIPIFEAILRLDTANIMTCDKPSSMAADHTPDALPEYQEICNPTGSATTTHSIPLTLILQAPDRVNNIAGRKSMTIERTLRTVAIVVALEPDVCYRRAIELMLERFKAYFEIDIAALPTEDQWTALSILRGRRYFLVIDDESWQASIP